MCNNIEISKEFFDVIMRLKRQSHANIKLKDLYAGEFMALRIIYKLKMMQGEESIGVKTSDIGNCLFMKKPEKKKIDLTQKGVDLLQKHHRSMINYTNEVINRLGEEDTKTLVKLLNKLCNIMEDLDEN